jgi:U6 snRNA-associated Sm-like protein LSm8
MEPNAGSPLVNLLEKYVQIVTADGRIFVGTELITRGFLRGLDQTMNAVLSQCQERIYSTDNDVEVEPLGLFFLRGDTIVMMGEADP